MDKIEQADHVGELVTSTIARAMDEGCETGAIIWALSTALTELIYFSAIPGMSETLFNELSKDQLEYLRFLALSTTEPAGTA